MGIFNIFKKKISTPSLYNSEGILVNEEYFRKKREEDAIMAQKCKKAFENVYSFLKASSFYRVHKVIYDKNNNPTFILISEHRDSLNINIISSEMEVRGITIVGRPNIMCKVLTDSLHIIDLPPNNYQNMGYGSMLINEIIQIAKEKNFKKITGTLSPVDAKTPEDRERRNNFYLNRGFKIENGKIELLIK